MEQRQPRLAKQLRSLAASLNQRGGRPSQNRLSTFTGARAWRQRSNRDRTGTLVNAAVRIGTRRTLFTFIAASTEGDPDREAAMQIFSSVSAEPDP